MVSFGYVGTQCVLFTALGFRPCAHRYQAARDGSICGMHHALFSAGVVLFTGLAASMSGGCGKIANKYQSLRVQHETLLPIAWVVIYCSNVVAVVYLLMRGLVESDSDNANRDDEFNASAFVGAAFFMTLKWFHVFHLSLDESKSTLLVWLPTFIFVATAVFSITGVSILRPGLSDNMAAVVFLGIPWGLFTGWAIIMAVLSKTISQRVKEQGNDVHNEEGNYLLSNTAAVVQTVVAVSTGSPAVSAPTLAVCAYSLWSQPGGLSLILLPFIISLLGILGGLLRVAL